uniref:Putative xyloglucan endotransglucosylase/hydrolase protein 28 n=1 Tax=Aegilops tauschii TaxID=37682 RepID=M8BNX2_AEGTA
MAMKARLLAAAATCVCLAAAASAFDVPTVAFEEGFSPLFGDGNLVRARDDRAARLLLDRRSGSGFISSDYYLHGFFSASIKLPRDYTAGVVVAFYLSNGDVYEKTHDELDFEFLGSRFYVDDTPIREVVRHPGMGGDFPAKPMAVYATIWDGSAWATEGGKYKVNYKYAPFASDFSDLSLRGCRVADPAALSSDAAGGRAAAGAAAGGAGPAPEQGDAPARRAAELLLDRTLMAMDFIDFWAALYDFGVSV